MAIKPHSSMLQANATFSFQFSANQKVENKFATAGEVWEILSPWISWFRWFHILPSIIHIGTISNIISINIKNSFVVSLFFLLKIYIIITTHIAQPKNAIQPFRICGSWIRLSKKLFHHRQKYHILQPTKTHIKIYSIRFSGANKIFWILG